MLLTTAASAVPPGRRCENVVVVTLDSMRWQEIFRGADSLLSFDAKAGYDKSGIQRKYWDAVTGERRKKLMPCFWGEMARNG